MMNSLRQSRISATRLVSMWALVAFGIGWSLISCGDNVRRSLQGFSQQDLEALRAWSLRLISTNSGRIPQGHAYQYMVAPLPDCLKRVEPPYSPWAVAAFRVNSNDVPHLSLVSMGSYAS